MDTKELNLRNLRLAPFILAILCFFMPFMKGEVSISGIQFVTGFQMHSEAAEMLNNFQSLDPYAGKPQSTIQKVPGDPKIGFVMICAIVGAAFSFSKSKRRKLFPAIAGGVGLATMILTKIVYDNEGTKQGGGFEFLSGFYLVAIFLLAGSILAGQQYQQEKNIVVVAAPPPPPPPPPPPAP